MDPLWPFMSGGIAAMIVLIGALVVWRIVNDRRSGFPIADERTQKVNGKAALYAVYIGGYFMVALMLVQLIGQEFLGFPVVEAGYALVASILVLNLTFLGLRWYFNRKGDF